MAKYEDYTIVSYEAIRDALDRADLSEVRLMTTSAYEADEGGKVEVIAAEVPTRCLESFWAMVTQEAHYAGRTADAVQAIRTYSEAASDPEGTTYLVFQGFRWDAYPEDVIEGTVTAADGKLQVPVRIPVEPVNPDLNGPDDQ